MPVAPYYEPLSVEETLTYLRAVAGSVDIPVMVYNLPVATGVDLDPDTVGALAREVENIRYIKNTTIDMAQSAALIHNHGDVISTFVGWDSLLLSALAEGAAGVMAGTANVVPAELVAVYDAVSAGDLDGRPSGLGPDLPAHRRDHERALHRGGQGGPGGGGLPRRWPRALRSPSSTPTRPPASRSSATGDDDPEATMARPPRPATETASRGAPGARPPAASCRRATCRPVSTSSTAHSGPGASGTSIDVVDPSSERDDRRRSPRARPRTPTRGGRRAGRAARVGPR